VAKLVYWSLRDAGGINDIYTPESGKERLDKGCDAFIDLTETGLERDYWRLHEMENAHRHMSSMCRAPEVSKHEA